MSMVSIGARARRRAFGPPGGTMIAEWQEEAFQARGTVAPLIRVCVALHRPMPSV
jgi:hypothetical protein